MSFPRTTRVGTQLIVVLTVVLVFATACDWTQFRYVAGPLGIERGPVDLDRPPSPAWCRGGRPRPAARSAARRRSSGGVAYVGSDDHKLYAFDAATGAVEWSVTTGGAVASSPAVDDGTVYVGSDDHKLHAFRASDGHAASGPSPSTRRSAASASAPTVSQGRGLGRQRPRASTPSRPTARSFRATPITTSGPLSAPTVAGNLVLTSSYADATVWAYRIDTGALAWSTTDPGPRASCPTATSVAGGQRRASSTSRCAPPRPRRPPRCSPTAPTTARRSGRPARRRCPRRPRSRRTVHVRGLVVGPDARGPRPDHGALQWTRRHRDRSPPHRRSSTASCTSASDDHRLLGFDATGATSCAGTPKTCTPIWSVTDAAARCAPRRRSSTASIYVGSDDQQLHAYGLPPIGFGKSTLHGHQLAEARPSSRFGPDGRLYVAEPYGTIKAYTVARNGPNSYRVTATEDINLDPADPQPRRRRHPQPHGHDPAGRPGWSSPARRPTRCIYVDLERPTRRRRQQRHASPTSTRTRASISRLTRQRACGNGSTWCGASRGREENHSTNTHGARLGDQHPVRGPGRQHQHGRAVEQLRLPPRVRVLGRHPQGRPRRHRQHHLRPADARRRGPPRP